MKKWLKMKTWEFPFVQQNIFISSLCDSYLLQLKSVGFSLETNIAINSGWSLWALLVEFFCLNASTIKYFRQSWSPCSLFAASGEPARRVKRASGGAGGRSPPPKEDICFKSGECLAKHAHFPLLLSLWRIISVPKQLGLTLTCKSNLLQLQFGTALCKVCEAAQLSTIRGMIPVHSLSVCTHQLFPRWG